MNKLIAYIILISVLSSCSANRNLSGLDKDRKALEQTSINIRTAFANGDIPTIMSYHHPDVVKALGYKIFLTGRAAVESNLKETFQNVKLNFTDNVLESLLIQGSTATEIALFTIEGKPKDGSKPFIFKGRAMVVYVRHKSSPTGWASIRELIQPATE